MGSKYELLIEDSQGSEWDYMMKLTITTELNNYACNSPKRDKKLDFIYTVLNITSI